MLIDFSQFIAAGIDDVLLSRHCDFPPQGRPSAEHDFRSYRLSREFQAYRRIKESISHGRPAMTLPSSTPMRHPRRACSAGWPPGLRSSAPRSPLPGGCLSKGDHLVRVLPSDEREEYPLGMIRLPGRHNVENVMAAILAARECGAPRGDHPDGGRVLRHQPRIEYAGEKNGVRFYDDSKGTNVGAVARALQSFSSPVILLLGGRDKEGDFERSSPSSASGSGS